MANEQVALRKDEKEETRRASLRPDGRRMSHNCEVNFRVREVRVIIVVVFCVRELSRGIVRFFAAFASERCLSRRLVIEFLKELLSASA